MLGSDISWLCVSRGEALDRYPIPMLILVLPEVRCCSYFKACVPLLIVLEGATVIGILIGEVWSCSHFYGRTLAEHACFIITKV
jgi:hypothetical protein